MQLEDNSRKLAVIQDQIITIRADQLDVKSRTVINGGLIQQMGEQILELQRTMLEMTVGKMASPLSHELDRRVSRIEAYIELDRALKTEMSWWFRTLGAAAIMWLASQIWSRLSIGRRKHRL